MWQAEVRKLTRRQASPEAFRGIAGRIMSDLGNAGGLPRLLGVYLGSRGVLGGCSSPPRARLWARFAAATDERAARAEERAERAQRWKTAGEDPSRMDR